MRKEEKQTHLYQGSSLDDLKKFLHNRAYPWYEQIYNEIQYIFRKVYDIPYKIKYFIQRGVRGYSDYDIWSFDHYLTKIILEGLVSLKAKSRGCPCTMNDATGKYDYDEARWNNILDNIIDGFAIVMRCQEGTELEWGGYVDEATKSRLNKTFKEKGLGRLTTKEEEECVRNAFNLFRDYYWSLWS